MSIWSLVGGLVGDRLNRNENRRTRAEDHARQDTSIQRLVKDAQAANISPLAALGSSAAGSNATPVGSSNTGNYIGDAISSAGQAFSNRGAKKLQLENASLQNELLQAQIDSINSQTVATATSRTRIPTEAQHNSRVMQEFISVDRGDGTRTKVRNPALAMDASELAVLLGQLDLYSPKDPGPLPKDPPAHTVPHLPTYKERMDRMNKAKARFSY